MRRTISLVSAVIASALAVTMTACSSGETTVGESGGTLTVGMASMSLEGNVSPYTAAGGYPIELLYDGLLDRKAVQGSDPEYVPALATSWELSAVDDRVSMSLREDVVFSDGTPFNAEAVARNFEAVEDSEGQMIQQPPAVNLGKPIVEITGEYSILIRWEKHQGRHEVLSNLEQIRIVSPAALDDVDSLEHTAVGTGPYVSNPDNTAAGSQVSFVPNPEGSWDSEVYLWDEIVVKEFSDNIAILNALNSGQIDVGPVDLASAVEAEASGLELFRDRGRFTGLYFVDRDGELVPAIGDLRVRQAINMAFDRQAIVENVEQGLGEPSNQAWSVGFPFYRPDLEDRYPYDPSAARSLLAEAGYPDGFDLPLPSFGSPYEPAVQQALADIGITVIYEPLPAAEFFPTLGKYAAFLNVGPYGPHFMVNVDRFYLPTEYVYNALADADPNAESLLETYAFGDETESTAAAAHLGELILDEAWFAPMTHPYSIWAHDPDLHVIAHAYAGVSPSPRDMRPAR